MNKNQVIVGLAVLAVGSFIFAYLMSRPNAKKGSVNMSIGKVSLKMDVENDLQSIKSALDKIFADPNAKREAEATLAEFYKIYSIHDQRIIDAVAGLSPDDPISSALRELSNRQKGPFRRELKQVRISFPGGPSFGEDDAVVCSGSDLLGQKIYIYDTDEERSVLVTARNSRPCLTPKAGNIENIQVTIKVGRKLFGDRPLQKFEPGLVGPA
jgi:hypothetical protein